VNKHWILGVDPGVGGGVCLLNADEGIVELISTPETVLGCYIWTKKRIEEHGRKVVGNYAGRAVMEVVSGYVAKKETGGDTGSSQFVFGVSYGRWEGIIAALGLWPYDNPSPQKWQRAVGFVSVKDETYSSRKRRLCLRARELYNNDKRITLKTCDALLIAHYGKLL
jgi:hypothetical protein